MSHDGRPTVLTLRIDWQNFASALPDWERLATNYFQPLAHYIKHELRASDADGEPLRVWSSPDAVGNWTRYPRHDMLGPRLVGDLYEPPPPLDRCACHLANQKALAVRWEQMFLMAPDFSSIALQVGPSFELPLFFPIFSRFFRDFWPCSLDSWRPDAENGRKMGESG